MFKKDLTFNWNFVIITIYKVNIKFDSLSGKQWIRKYLLTLYYRIWIIYNKFNFSIDGFVKFKFYFLLLNIIKIIIKAWHLIKILLLFYSNYIVILQ